MKCPKCNHEQENGIECGKCGIIFVGYYKARNKTNFNKAVEHFYNKNWDKSKEIFEYLIQTKNPVSDDIVEQSRGYIKKIEDQKILESEKTKDDGKSFNLRDDVKDEITSIEKQTEKIVDSKKSENSSEQIGQMPLSLLKKLFNEENEDREAIGKNYDVINKKPKKTIIIIKSLSYSSIIVLLFISFYLHWVDGIKLKQVAHSITGATEKSISKTEESISKLANESQYVIQYFTSEMLKHDAKINILAKQIEINDINITKLFNAVKEIGSNAHSHGYSDIRLKNKVAPINDTLDKISSINSYSFYYNKTHPKLSFDERIHYGFMAQEIEKIYPELVFEDNYGYKNIDYISIIPLLLNAIKEQNSKILTLEKLIIEKKISIIDVNENKVFK